MPQTFKQYFVKSRNWRNGCRAREYSDGLFPDMINASMQFAACITKQLSLSLQTKKSSANIINWTKWEQEMAKTFEYTYLLILLQKQIKVVNSARRVNLLSDNIIKVHQRIFFLLYWSC